MGLQSTDALRFLLTLSIVLLGSRFLGALAVRLGAPRVIGEIGSGFILGPSVLEWLCPGLYTFLFTDIRIMPQLLGVPFWLGLGFLMFVSGYELNIEKDTRDTRLVFVLVAATTLFPFACGMLLTTSNLLGWQSFGGASGDVTKLGVIMGVAMAITSIPVISRIFLDLGIADSRFARVVLSVAGVHDVILWGVVAMVLTTEQGGLLFPWNIAGALGLFALAIAAIPLIIRRWGGQLTGWMEGRTIAGPIILLWGMSAGLGLLGTEFIFGAMAAGFLVRRLSDISGTRFGEQIKGFSISTFIPVYFALVGVQVNLASDLPFVDFLVLLLATTLLQVVLVWTGARLCGRSNLDGIALAVSLNAKGGPGIALATLAFQQGIINVRMFSMLVLLAVVTSWMAGAWLQFALRRYGTIMPQSAPGG